MKSIIITGGARGLGSAVTAKVIKEGYQAIAIDLNNAALEELKVNHPENLVCYELDVSDYDGAAALFEDITRFDLLGLVNNAGIYPGKSILEYSPEEIAKVLDVNLKGAIYMTRFFARYMIEKRKEGAIVNISSSSVYGGSDAVYSASKAALIGLTKANAKNFSPYIRVNAINPGIVMTDIFEGIPEHILQWYRENELVKKPITPESVAESVFFLLSEKSQNYTGAVFELNNGFHL